MSCGLRLVTNPLSVTTAWSTHFAPAFSKSVFYEFGRQRTQFVGELQGLVRELGGDPEDTGSVSATLHRGWINIKAVLTGKDEAAILNEAERGEDIAKNAYEKATAMSLPANVSSVIQKQYAEVKMAHDKIRDLRDAANAGGSSSASTSR